MGIIFSAVERAVESEYGADAWDEILRAADDEGGFTALGNYPTARLGALVEAAAGHLEVSTGEALEVLGESAFPFLYEEIGARSNGYHGSQELFESLDQRIHAEVTRIHPASHTPRFAVERTVGGLRLEYRSHRHLCRLAVGLARGAVVHFEEEADVQQTACREENGGESCLIQVHYRTRASAA